MSTVPLTPSERDALVAALHDRCPNLPRWMLEAPTASDRGLLLCGPAGIRLRIEVPWNAPERLQVSGLFPASPQGSGYLPPTQTVPAVTVARARGVQALATAIVRRLLPDYRRRHRHGSARIATP